MRMMQKFRRWPPASSYYCSNMHNMCWPASVLANYSSFSFSAAKTIHLMTYTVGSRTILSIITCVCSKVSLIFRLCLSPNTSLNAASSGAQGRLELQGRAEEIRVFSELLTAVEQNFFKCQGNLHFLQRKCSEKSESIRQLQLKVWNTSCLKSDQ